MTPSAIVDPAHYLGDNNLAQLLARERSGKSVADVRGMIAGVLAAPEDVDPGLWLGLVVEEPSDELAQQLQALKQALKERTSSGLEIPAPAWRLNALRDELQRLDLTVSLYPMPTSTRARCSRSGANGWPG